MTTPRVLFAGTPAFALASLEALVQNGVVPVAVLTQPDRPAGRGKKFTASPVKRFAVEKNIPVMQPQNLRDEDVVAELDAWDADLMIVAAYGLILPKQVLDLPKRGCLNVHASLLPRWRGAAPIQAAILAGDEHTGISLMAMTEGLDCGPVFVTASLDIGPNETAGGLHDRLARLGGECLVANLDSILDGRSLAVEQDEACTNYAPKINTADAELTWTSPADELARKVRAYNPVPGAWFMHEGERIKCWQASQASNDDGPDGDTGQVINVDDGIVVACAAGALRLECLQRPGKRRVSAREMAAQVELAGTYLN